MKKHLSYIFFSFFLVLVTSCDPVEVPEPDVEGPIFYTQMKVDGQAVDWSAGKDDYNAEPRNQFNQGEVFFRSVIKPKDCPVACPLSLEFIYSSEVPFSGALDMSRALSVGNKNFHQEVAADSAVVKVFDRSTGDVMKKTWSLNEKVIQPRRDQDSLLFKISISEKNKICLQVEDRLRNISRQCQSFSASDIEVPRTTIKVVDARSALLRANPLSPYDLPSIRGKWNYQNQTGFDLRVLPKDLLTNEFCFTSFKSADVESESCIKLTNATNFNLQAHFNIEAIRKLVVNTIIPTGRVVLNYRNEMGRLYSTLQNPRVDVAELEVVEIADFTDPNTMEDLKSVEVSFQGRLYRKDGTFVTIEDGKAVFPVKIVR